MVIAEGCDFRLRTKSLNSPGYHFERCSFNGVYVEGSFLFIDQSTLSYRCWDHLPAIARSFAPDGIEHWTKAEPGVDSQSVNQFQHALFGWDGKTIRRGLKQVIERF